MISSIGSAFREVEEAIKIKTVLKRRLDPIKCLIKMKDTIIMITFTRIAI